MDAIQEKSTIKGKHIAITGILAFYKRQDAFDQIEACGGFSQNNVTQYTDYLVIGYYRRNSIHGEKSNKTRLAEKYIRQGKKIAIIREDEFLGMLWQTS
jgi:NAD-dependent DNA ligase